MDIKYLVGSSAVVNHVTQTTVNGSSAEVHQQKLVVELSPVDPQYYGTIKLVLDPAEKANFVSNTVITASFVASKG